MRVNDFERGFIVGLIEGEGTVSVLKQNKGKRGYNYISLIEISNTNVPLLEKAKNIIGGGIYKGSRAFNQKKQRWVLRINSNHKVKEILDLIINDLIVKKDVAIKVLEYANLRIKRHWSHNHSGEDEIVKEIRRLNKK